MNEPRRWRHPVVLIVGMNDTSSEAMVRAVANRIGVAIAAWPEAASTNTELTYGPTLTAEVLNSFSDCDCTYRTEKTKEQLDWENFWIWRTHRRCSLVVSPYRIWPRLPMMVKQIRRCIFQPCWSARRWKSKT